MERGQAITKAFGRLRARLGIVYAGRDGRRPRIFTASVVGTLASVETPSMLGLRGSRCTLWLTI